MSIFYLFRQNRPFEIPHLTTEEEDYLQHLIKMRQFGELEKWCRSEKIDLEHPLHNGESILSSNINKTQQLLLAHNEKRQQFFDEQDNLDDLVWHIQDLQDGIKNEAHKCAAVLFSSSSFLEKLKIPKEQWAEKILGKPVFDQALQTRSHLFLNNADLENSLEISGWLYSTQKNIYGDVTEKTQAQFAELLLPKRAYDHEKKMAADTKDTLDILDNFKKETYGRIEGSLFIKLVTDSDVVEQCPWIKDVALDEETFLNLFDPDWNKKELKRDHWPAFLREIEEGPPKIAPVNEEETEEMIMTFGLEKMGYYNWRPDYLDEEKERLLKEKEEREKRQKDAQQHADTLWWMQENTRIQERQKRRGRDRGMDMSR